MPPQDKHKSLKILFIHPNLGIGGAERLIVDGAVGFQERGHRVDIWTSFRDPSHCFDEARDGTLSVHVPPQLLPHTFLGRFAILFAILRQLQLVLTLYFKSLLTPANAPDLIIADQLSACLPLLRLIAPTSSILFYVHFPDLLLASHTTLLQKIYRSLFDSLEAFSTGAADGLAVNSEFTRSVFRETFPGLARRDVSIIYPCIDTHSPRPTADASPPESLWGGKHKILLSLNRFEAKKNIELAIQAYAGLPQHLRSSTRLVIAGGYDSRLVANVGYHRALEGHCDKLSLSHLTARTLPTALSCPPGVQVLFLPSVTTPLKTLLLSQAALLLYTPANEHFGIVPLEAMLVGTPVLAADSGGPLETVCDPLHAPGKREADRSGWLRGVEDVKAWTSVVREVLSVGEADREKIGRRGRESVIARFSREAMAEKLEDVATKLIEERRAGTRRPILLLENLPLYEAGGILVIFIAALVKIFLLKQ